MPNKNPTKIEGIFTLRVKARKFAVKLVQTELNYLEAHEQPFYSDIWEEFKNDKKYVAGGTIYYIEEHEV